MQPAAGEDGTVTSQLGLGGVLLVAAGGAAVFRRPGRDPLHFGLSPNFLAHPSTPPAQNGRSITCTPILNNQCGAKKLPTEHDGAYADKPASASESVSDSDISASDASSTGGHNSTEKMCPNWREP